MEYSNLLGTLRVPICSSVHHPAFFPWHSGRHYECWKKWYFFIIWSWQRRNDDDNAADKEASLFTWKKGDFWIHVLFHRLHGETIVHIVRHIHSRRVHNVHYGDEVRTHALSKEKLNVFIHHHTFLLFCFLGEWMTSAVAREWMNYIYPDKLHLKLTYRKSKYKKMYAYGGTTYTYHASRWVEMSINTKWI